jgi:hypothetical protein
MTEKIIVLAGPHERDLDLTRAVPDAVERCLVVTGGPMPAGSERAAAVAQVHRYDADSIVAAARHLAIGHPVERVVSFAEADVLAAALLREEWDLPGQRSTGAVAYRDKLAMRRHTAAAGLAGPAFAAVETTADVRRFVAEHGLPAVCKPRSGSGSAGVRVLHTPADVAALPQALPYHLVEGYVAGEVVHVDGVWAGGGPLFALPATYTDRGCLAYLSDRGSGSALLAADHPWHLSLVTALWNVVRALPAAPDLVVHAEFFVGPDTPPVLCEIASRLPGHPIPPMIDRALGVSLRDTWFRLGAGLPVDLGALAAAAAHPPAVANYGLPPRLGELVALPDAVPAECADWVRDLRVLGVPGERWDESRYAARRSGDFVVTWTVTAADHGSLGARLTDSARRLGETIRWRAPEDAAAARPHPNAAMR